MPSLKDGKRYLLPRDGDPDNPEITGFPVDLLYSNLAKIRARSITVILDACFSGDSPDGRLIRAVSGLNIVAKQTKAPAANTGFSILTAARANQVASWDQDAKLGLFTKYFLNAVNGSADISPHGNSDGRVTLREIRRYLDREMTYAARRRYGREQRATVIGNDDKVMVAIKK